jgi:hypothetical protein
MTFSGLPSLRDPKHSLKNSASSASSSPSSSPTSSPTTKPVSDQQPAQQSGTVLSVADHSTVHVAPPSTTTTSLAADVQPVVTESSSGAMMLVTADNISSEVIPISLIENSFQGLIQSSFGHVLSSLPPQTSSSSSSMADLHQLQVHQSPPVSMFLPPMGSPTPIVAKKKATPQNLSPAHSAAYRKRLNVNQGTVHTTLVLSLSHFVVLVYPLPNTLEPYSIGPLCHT